MSDRVAIIVSKVLEIPLGVIVDDTSPDCVERWDSLRHLQLVMALETEFGISLSPENVMEMLSVGLIRMTLRDLGVPLD